MHHHSMFFLSKVVISQFNEDDSQDQPSQIDVRRSLNSGRTDFEDIINFDFSGDNQKK